MAWNRSFDDLIDEVIGTAERVGKSNVEFRNRKLAQDKDVASMQFGPAGTYDRQNLSRERIAEMEHGRGGVQDRGMQSRERIASMEHGVGGSQDRTAAGLETVRKAQAGLYGAQAGAAEADLPYMKKLNEMLMKKMDGSEKPAEPKRRFAEWYKPGQLTTGEEQRDLETEGWKPTSVRPLDWMLRRGRNIMEAPARMWDYMRYR